MAKVAFPGVHTLEEPMRALMAGLALMLLSERFGGQRPACAAAFPSTQVTAL